MKKQQMDKLGNLLVVVLALALVAAYAVNVANRTEARLAARMAK